MTFQEILTAFDSADINSMSKGQQINFVRDIADRVGLSTNQLINLIRGKRNGYRINGMTMADWLGSDAALQIAQRGIVAVALFKARRCYHAQFGR